MAAPAAAEKEEVPLLIQDYSCANSFEEHVRGIENFLAPLFETEPLLRQFFVPSTLSATAASNTRVSRRAAGSPPATTERHRGWTAASDDCRSDDADGAKDRKETGRPASSPPPPLDATRRSADVCAASPPSQTFTHAMTLYAPSSPTTNTAGQAAPPDIDCALVLEVHVRNAAHPITRQHGLPLFFLLRKATTSASYREGETNYLLSLLATAVRQVLQRQRHHAVLRLGPVTPDCATAPASAVSALPSPFAFPDGCAPCFAPAGDSYKECFAGLSPPLPTRGLPPLPPPSSPSSSSTAAEMSTAEMSLIHQRTFTTRFLSDAFPHPPANCRTLSDFIDLFQSHVGQHSRIRSDDFEGICVSMWETYVLPTPWKFYPRGPSTSRSKASSATTQNEEGDASTTTAAAGTALTWDEVLQRENAHTRLLAGAFTHAFGTAAPPLKHVSFRFQWRQLQDVEAQDSSGRSGHLDPFHFSLLDASTTAQATTTTAAAQAAQRKCCITAQAVPRTEEAGGGGGVGGGVARTLCTALAQHYLEHQTPPAAVAAEERADEAAAAAAVVAASAQSPTAARPRSSKSGESKLIVEEAQALTAALLADLATRVVEWTGANVSLQASLLCRFSSPCAVDDPTDGKTSREGASAVARRLRALRGTWEAHQQHFPVADREAEEQSRTTASASPFEESGSGGSAGVKDLRNDYFPDSFFCRFAHACATHELPAEDVVALWGLCVERLRALLLPPPAATGEEECEEERRQKWRRLLDCLALPPADPPIDLSQPVLSQKFQLLRFSLVSLLQPSRGSSSHLVDDDAQPADTTASATLRLITHGEPVVTPAPLPTPPTTSDEVLRRAMQLNTHGSAAVDMAPMAWLYGDALYNDMCLFLFANKAQEGRVVRFPDFVHWHSPRDFVCPPPSSPTAGLSESDYLSDRMKDASAVEGVGGGGGGGGSRHVWWALWARAVPRSRSEILRTLFDPHAAAAATLDWLAGQTGIALLVEVHNACVANALHQLLCHRFLLGDAASAVMGKRGGGGSGFIPPSPRLPALHAAAQELCTRLTKDLEAASAVVSSRSDVAAGGTRSLPSGSSAVEAMELEMMRAFAASAMQELGALEVQLCVAVAVHYLLGFSADAEAAATVRAICSLASSAGASPHGTDGGVRMRTVTVSRATWATCFAKQFLHPESRLVRESMARLTCMAERPLNTLGCFQQLVVHRDSSNTLRMALALTQEVL